MKFKFLFFFWLSAIVEMLSQTGPPFNYSVRLQPVGINGLTGLHSYAFAQASGKWLIIGGRKDGLHARQPFNAFPASNNNTDIYVIDIMANQVWSASVNVLSTGLKEQLQSTNMNFYQDGDSLYLIGGYGYSQSAADHLTYPNLTSVSISGLMSAIINSNPIAPHFKQITDQNFAVNGGHLGKIGNTFYLIGGHRFDGRYNPMGNPTYTQQYVDGYRKFTINNAGPQLSYSNYSLVTDQVHLHRRDYNLVPQIFPNGDKGYTLFSGVFQVSVDLPFLYPVDITGTGYQPVTGFNQFLSNYHCANAALYDSINNVMHSIFFGGMSQYYYQNNNLVQDNNVPFVKTISRVSRDAAGNLTEAAFPIQMPALLGASAEFIPNHQVPHYSSDIIKLSSLTGDSVLIGYIYGGIYSPQLNPFSGNITSVTSAHPIVYEVWLIKTEIITRLEAPEGKNLLKTKLFPNPVRKEILLHVHSPEDGNLEILVTNQEGRLVTSAYFEHISEGIQTVDVSSRLKIPAGVYHFTIILNNKYTNVEKVVLSD